MNFFFRLSGTAAVKAKNVHLSLIDQHTHLSGRGIVQLFTQPHPRRLLPSPYSGRSPPRLPTIGRSHPVEELTLPLDYNPTGLMRQLETVNQFVHDHNEMTRSPSDMTTHQLALKRQRDVQWIATLALELFMPLQFRLLGIESTLEDRLRAFQIIFQCEKHQIPRFFRPFLKAVFDNETVTDRGLPPPSAHQLLQPMVSLIPFPAEFPAVLSIAKQLRQLLDDDCRSDFVTAGKMLSTLTSPSHVILLVPLVKALLQKSTTSVATALHLLDPVAVVLGQLETAKELLPILLKIMAPDQPSAPLALLYHKRFLLM